MEEHTVLDVIDHDDDELKHVDVSSKIQLYQQRIKRFTDFNECKNVNHCDPNNNNPLIKSRMVKRRSKSLPSKEHFSEVIPKENVLEIKMNDHNLLESKVETEDASNILPSVKLLAKRFSARKGFEKQFLINFLAKKC